MSFSPAADSLPVSRPAGLDLGAPRPLAVYVHLPFCREHCPYCDFYTVPASNPKSRHLGEYIGWLRGELALAAETLPELVGRPLRSLYLGGGTPSLYRPEHLAPFFEDFRRLWTIAPETEVTMEANPGSLLADDLAAYGALGVNRVSLGVQSFDDAALRELGRAHGSADARRSLDALAEADFVKSFSADLIFGYPRQTVETLRADLDELAGRNVPHISAYGLTLHPGTPYETRHRKGDLPLPNEEAVLAMFREVRRSAQAAGYEAYEFSNFAKPGHRAIHNSAYWELEPVLPLGGIGVRLPGRAARREPPPPRPLRRGHPLGTPGLDLGGAPCGSPESRRGSHVRAQAVGGRREGLGDREMRRRSVGALPEGNSGRASPRLAGRGELPARPSAPHRRRRGDVGRVFWDVVLMMFNH
jgi:putative oxygen-independent coproporphyrinogen III oxidase